MKYLFLGLILVSFLGIVPRVQAVTDQVRITQSIIGVDASAPTVPSNVVLTPVGIDQIDITWDASVDNSAVDGYQIFRDGMQIATSVGTSYSDVGLTSETSYAYTITAFDVAGNISAPSATTTATTGSVVVNTTPGGGPLAPGVVPYIRNLVITADEYSAHITWDTQIPTRSTLSWGITEEYEIASLGERSFSRKHSTQLTELVPDTRYVFKIVARDYSGAETVLAERSFVTRALPDTEAPANVENLQASVTGNDVTLSWQNPEVSDFDHVRIVRRENGYPADPYDGTLIYEGNGEEYRDQNVLTSDSARFYAVFAYDKIGNGASGAVIRVAKNKEGVVTDDPEKGKPVVSTEGGASLQFRDLIFVQDGKEISYIGNEVTIGGGKKFEIRIPYERLPEHLKTILVTLVDPRDTSKTFSFLLRVNADKTAYSALIAPLTFDGEYALSLSLLDYGQQTLSYVEGVVVVETKMPTDNKHDQGLIGFLTENSTPGGYWQWVFFSLLALVVLYIVSHTEIRLKRR